jgi:hypothetical protein
VHLQYLWRRPCRGATTQNQQWRTTGLRWEQRKLSTPPDREPARRPLPIRRPAGPQSPAVSREHDARSRSADPAGPHHNHTSRSPDRRFQGSAAAAAPSSETRAATCAGPTNRRRRRRAANASTVRCLPAFFGGRSRRHRGEARGSATGATGRGSATVHSGSPKSPDASDTSDRSSTRPGQRSPSWALPKLVADRPPPCPALAVGRCAPPWPEVAESGAGRTQAFTGGRGRHVRCRTREMGGRWQDRGHRCVRRQLRRQAAGPRPSMRAAALRLVGIGDKIGGSRN